jgi:hypothetical protein
MFTISPSIRLAKSQDGGILLDTDGGTLFSLNPVGVRIVELLQEGHEAASLAETISGEFGVSPEIVRNDVANFLANLQEQQLLNERPPSNGFKYGDR